MKTIWKYELNPNTTEILVPLKAEILCVQVQRNTPCVWILVDTNEDEKGTLLIDIYGTGQDIYNHPGIYIGTFQLNSGALVFHAFERRY